MFRYVVLSLLSSFFFNPVFASDDGSRLKVVRSLAEMTVSAEVARGRGGIIAFDIDEVLLNPRTKGPMFPDMIRQVKAMIKLMSCDESGDPLVVCLTARPYFQSAATMAQLNSIGIYSEYQYLPDDIDDEDVLKLTDPVSEAIFSGESCGYTNGVIYCYDVAYTAFGFSYPIDKGAKLKEYCAHLRREGIPYSSGLMFADDQRQNLHKVAQTDYEGMLTDIYLFHVDPAV